MLKNLCLTVIGLQIVLGCGLANAQVSKLAIAPFDESVWRVEKLLNQKKTIPTYQGEKNYASISFNPYTHKVTGRGLCNNFMAKFENKNNTVTINDVVTTRKMCISDDVNAQDRRFFSYLNSVKYYSIHGKILRLEDEHNQPLIIARWAK